MSLEASLKQARPLKERIARIMEGICPAACIVEPEPDPVP